MSGVAGGRRARAAEPRRVQVAVVGGGPVGVGLAIELAQRGVDCVVIERRREVSRIPKGQSLYQRTLEHFWSWGVEAAIRSARELPLGHPIGGVTVYHDLGGEHWYLPPQPSGVNDFFFQANERLPQYRTEEVLRRRLAELGVELLGGATVVGLAHGGSGSAAGATGAGGSVRLRLRRAPRRGGARGGADGAVDEAAALEEIAAEEEIEADYVVGCDGAHSLVRAQLGIERRGRDFDRQMALCVFRSRALHELLGRFPERTTYRVLHPDYGGAWLFFGRVDLGETWFFHGPVRRGTADSDEEAVRSLMYVAAGREFACEIEHIGFFELRCDVADSYRRGRVLLAGDACHSHPPYGGLGLNTGIDDATNLGWKLAAVLEGWGGESLLDSYGEERRPIAVETTEMIAGWIEKEAEFLARFRPDLDRGAFDQAWGRRTDGENLPPWYEPHYEGSPLVASSAGGRPGIRGEHRFDARPGHHLAPWRLGSGTDVYERLGRWFTVVALGEGAGLDRGLERLLEPARRLRIPLEVVREAGAGGRQRYGCGLVLVRPDRFVAWCGDEVPADADGLWRRVSGAPASSAAEQASSKV